MNQTKERKPKKKYSPFKFGDGAGTIFPLKNIRRTHRNDPCPCGQTMEIHYPGTTLAPIIKPLKFKNCCLNELGPQSNTIPSTANGWPRKMDRNGNLLPLRTKTKKLRRQIRLW